jgi:hypothetical protein
MTVRRRKLLSAVMGTSLERSKLQLEGAMGSRDHETSGNQKGAKHGVDPVLQNT